MPIKRFLYLAALIFALDPTGLNAQLNYADSTIVYLTIENNPTESIGINWIDKPGTSSSNFDYRLKGVGNFTVASVDSNAIPDSDYYRYRASLTNLLPNRFYEFRYSDVTTPQEFRTIPEVIDEKVSFLVIGDVYGDGEDPAFDTAAFQFITSYARSYYPSFVVLAGDLIHLNDTNEYNSNTLNRFLKFLSEWTSEMRNPEGQHIPMVTAYGNHELPQRFGGQPANAKYYNALFSFPGLRGYNRLDFSDYLSLIVLNTDHTARIEGDQTEWLETQLIETQNMKNVFPVYHVSGYPASRDPLPGRGLEVKQYWSPLFDKYNVSFAFEHDRHEYKRTVPITADAPDACGVRYIGGGGYAILTGATDIGQWYTEVFSNQRHFVRVELTNSKRIVQTVAFDGQEIDYYEESIFIDPPPILAASSITSSGFTVNWQRTCDAVNYRLDISTDSNFSNFISGYDGRNVGSGENFVVTGLNPLTRYYFRLRAVDADGQVSSYSTVGTASTTSPPPVATAATQVESDRFTANWNSIPNVSNYVVDVSLSQNFTSYVGQYQDFDVGNATSIQITGLQSTTPYYYRVRAKNQTIGQASANSNTIGVITLPPPPDELEILTQTSASLSITWRESSQLDQYLVDVALDASFQNPISGYTDFAVNTNSVVIQGLNPLTTYYIRVKTRDLELNVTSRYSNIFSASTTGVPPTASAATNVQNESFVANWSMAQSADSYILDVALDQDFLNLIPGFSSLNVSNVSSYEVDGLLSGTGYYYRIKSFSTALNLSSEPSNVISVYTIPDTPLVSSPSEIQPRSFRANWNSVPRSTVYLVDVSEVEDFASFLDNWESRVITNDTTVVVDELSPNKEYFYRVRATTSDQSVISNYSDVEQLITTLEQPTDITLSSVRSNSFYVSWSESENAEEYVMDLATDPDFESLVSGYQNVSLGNDLETEILGLESAQTYYFRLRAAARSKTVNSLYSSPIVIVTLPVTPQINDPFDVKAVGFTATWSEVERITHYDLDIAFDSDFTQPFDIYSERNVGTETEVVVREVLPGTRLYYRTRAVNTELQVTSDWSSTKEVTTTTIDPITSTVEMNKLQVLANGVDFAEVTVTIRDSNSNPLDEVNVELQTQGGDSIIEVVSGTTGQEGTAVFNLTNEKAEFIRFNVTAIQTELSVTPEIAFVPVAPLSNLGTDILASSFVANWNPVNGAISYRLDVSQNADFSSYVAGYEDLDVELATSYQVSGLFPGDRYFYRVRAVAPTGTSVNSEVQSIVTPQADPNLSQIEITNSAVLADAISEAVVQVVVRNPNSEPMSGVPVRLETDDTHVMISSESVLSNEEGFAELRVSTSFAGMVVFKVFAGRVEINSAVNINFIPISPIAQDPSRIGAVEFTANWQKVDGATHYLLDISRDQDFENLLSAYNSLDVGDVNEYRVTGLQPGTTYFYRVRGATPTAVSDNSNTISVTTYQIDLANSTAIPSAKKILANGEQKTEVEVKLINEEGEPLSDVLVQLIPDESVYTIEVVQDVTDSDGIAKFNISSLVAGEGVFTVSAGGLELESKVEVIFLFADGEIKLGYNFPNPFGSTTRIPVTIPERMNVTIDVYNSFGQRVAELESKEFVAGYYEIPFMPRGLSSGAYIIRMVADGKVFTQKMMFIK